MRVGHAAQARSRQFAQYHQVMTTRVCPHCIAYSHFTEAWSDNLPGSVEIPLRGRDVNRFLEVCDNCGGLVCGTELVMTGETTLWPTVIHRKVYPDVPEAIAAAASEAHQAPGADAPRAAVAMARAVIEATAKEKGIVCRGIQSKIEALAANGHISEAMKETAHEIRFAGNEVAHGDLVDEPISVEDASEIVRLMDSILEYVYQGPAEVARIRAKREARKSRQEPAEAIG
jgi:hypothetical protein